MPRISRNFIAGKMNKIIDQRLLPEGEYIDAMNIRMGSTENSELGVIENTKGNSALTTLSYIDGTLLSINAVCIGAIEDNANDLIYWFVHDPAFPVGSTGKLDLIVSFNVSTNILTYHVISIDNGGGVNTTLNFNPTYLINGVNILGPLLFFTEDYNQPRFINTSRNYANPIGNIDQITDEQLLVIKKPPTQSPTVQPIVTNGQQNFMDTRFLCFAYRYRYIDGEYSATSQWSQVAFIPNPFSFTIDNMLNNGMTNSCNTAVITYNSGGPLVVGIDLLFKQSQNNIIKVIEKLDKANLGIPNNTQRQYVFNNSKIFTLLSSTEILRLYDNVPRLAKAQTIMGNRLMYGNYVEGYNLIDKDGVPIKLEYSTNLITEQIGISTLIDSQGDGSFYIDYPISIPNGVSYIDLAGKDLLAGSSISVKFTISHSAFSGDTPYPTETTDAIGLDFSFFLVNDYTSVYQMASSPEFQAAIGTIANILPVYSPTPGVSTSCDGTTFTDNVNCVLPNNLDALQKVASGISAVNQPINIITSPASTTIGFQFVAMKYVDNPASPTKTVYEYYGISFTSAIFQEIGNPQSLHSNRGYEIGIVYMDEFNRSTNALVSPNNTEYVPCGYSPNQNSIQVVIPPTQIAPYWAKRYKFVIKPDTEGYEVIYTNLFFADPDTNEVWFFLEGENTKKVEVGDRLIVKSDTSGPVLSCAYATVLDKASKAADFITPAQGGSVLAGVYMKINPTSFSAVSDPNAIVAPGRKQEYASVGGNYDFLKYPMNTYMGAGFDPLHPLWEYEDYSVPAGSRIVFDWDWDRGGTGSACEHRGYLFQKTFIASRDYDNMLDWFVGDNIASTFDTGFSKDNDTKIEYIPIVAPITSKNSSICYVQFDRNAVTNQLTIQYSTGKSCTGIFNSTGRRYYITVTNSVYRSLNNIIFETEPLDALPDTFYENNLSFEIDAYGNHMGNVQNQDIATTTPAIVNTEFFNCFAFGNGAESYKIRDSIIGRGFSLGERVTSVSEQNFMEADRFADITYSGVYNAESNINKLNEFNLGLLNYKNLETSFGDIFVLDGRQTDVLVLQEDKISYVLADKNLLSDSTGGGAITSVPEVLGTQIARTEKYGISFNPESYVQWGANRYFTDVKRGAVIQLIGDSYSNEQIKVISEANMRTWFRDEFIASFNTQKLGAFDPYMNEYVLSTNNTNLPIAEKCIDCGISQTVNLYQPTALVETDYSYCVTLGQVVGDTTISWVQQFNSGGDFKVTIEYNGSVYVSPWDSASGSYTFNKDNILVEKVYITVTYTSLSLVLDIIADCPIRNTLNIVEVVLTSNVDNGQDIHTQYRYEFGSFIGPLQSNLVTFASGSSNPLVSRYNIVSGYVGTGSFPPADSGMTLISNKIPPDTFDFNTVNDKFKYLRSTTFYPNTSVGITDLLNAALLALPNYGGGNTFYSEFTVPDGVNNDYLYLIWDFRNSLPIELCYSITEVAEPRKDVCCECTNCDTECVTVSIENLSSTENCEVYFPLGQSVTCGGETTGPISIELTPSEVLSVCLSNDIVNGFEYSIVSGNAIVTITSCGC